MEIPTATPGDANFGKCSVKQCNVFVSETVGAETVVNYSKCSVCKTGFIVSKDHLHCIASSLNTS